MAKKASMSEDVAGNVIRALPDIILIEEDRSGMTADGWARLAPSHAVTSTIHDHAAVVPTAEGEG